MLRTFVGADIILLLSFFLQFWLLVSYLLCYIFERTYVLKEQGVRSQCSFLKNKR